MTELKNKQKNGQLIKGFLWQMIFYCTKRKII